MRSKFFLIIFITSLSASAQLPVADTLMIREASHEGSHIFPMGENGLVVIYKNPSVNDQSGIWHWTHYNVYLQLVFDTIIAGPEGISEYRFTNNESGLCVFEKKIRSAHTLVYEYNPKNKKLAIHSFALPLWARPESVVRTGNYLFMTGTTESDIKLGRLDLKTDSFNAIPLTGNRIKSISVCPDKENKHIALVCYGEKKRNDVILVNILNTDGNEMTQAIEIPHEKNKWPCYAHLRWVSDSTLMVTGTYTDGFSNKRTGMFTCLLNFNSVLHSQFTSFTRFDNFYNHMEDESRNEKIQEQANALKKGDESYSTASLLENGVFKVGDNYFLVAENYSTLSNTTDLDDGVVVSSYSYVTTAFLIVCINADGKIQWNQMALMDLAPAIAPLQTIAAVQTLPDLLQLHTLTEDNYIKSSFMADGKGFENIYNFDNGALMEHAKKLTGSFEKPIPLTENKILMWGKFTAKPTTGKGKSYPALVFYSVNIF